MANRALAAKVELAKDQARDLARLEFSKPYYARHETIAGADKVRAESDALVAQFLAKGGKVTHVGNGVAANVNELNRVRGGYDGSRASRNSRYELTRQPVRAVSCFAR